VGELRTGYHYQGNKPGPFLGQPDSVLRTRLADVHLFFGQQRGHDWLTLRYRLGLHMGMLGRYAYSAEPLTKESDTYLAPEILLRLGHPRLLFAQYDSGYGAENALGAYTTRVALGSGLGHGDGRQLLLGYANSTHHPSPNMAFVSANLRLPAGTGLGALSLEPYFATNFDRHNIFSMKLNYRLGR
jgi:phosphatidylglycerol:prolipoprotein diacylglycerol transferase